MPFLLNLKKGFKRLFAAEMFQNPLIRKSVWGLIVFLSITLIMTIDFLPNSIKLKPGQVARKDYEAPITTTYIDREKTQKLRMQAAEQVQKVWKTDYTVSPAVQNKVKRFFNLIRQYQEIQPQSTEADALLPEKQPDNFQEKAELVKEETGVEISVEQVLVAEQLDTDELDSAEIYLLQLTLNYLNSGIQLSYLENVQTKMLTDIEADIADAQLADILSTIATQVIQPNLVLDVEETRRLQEEAMGNVIPEERTVRQGQIIIRSGSVVTDEDIAMLEALGLQRPQVNYRTISGLIIIILLLMLGIIQYIRQYHQKIFAEESMLVLLGLLSILILLIAKLFTLAQLSNVGYLVPVAAIAILISILIDAGVAIVATIILSLLIVLIVGGNIAIGAVLMISGVTGIFSVSKVSQRSDLVRAGFYVSGVSALAIFAFSLTEPLNWIEVLNYTVWGIINGILAAIMTNGLLPYLENVFGITSAVKLLELSNPNQPILKKLLLEAPGTYHHSILVGNLVDAAADKVGADPLLARIGAYYHDIGKMKRPYFFSDNQFAGDNPHDKLSPGLSTLIIKSHVKDGVEMARKYKLPRPIIDIIQQHHGTNLISFFYQQALKEDKYGNIDVDEFRYEGPKPQTKEAALIMLADVTEAAVRSKGFNRSNHNRIEGLVRELIHKKLEEGQLDECDLTLKDLDKIATSFTKVLTGIYHYRVEYPEKIVQEMKGVQVANGDSHKQS